MTELNLTDICGLILERPVNAYTVDPTEGHSEKAVAFAKLIEEHSSGLGCQAGFVREYTELLIGEKLPADITGGIYVMPVMWTVFMYPPKKSSSRSLRRGPRPFLVIAVNPKEGHEGKALALDEEGGRHWVQLKATPESVPEMGDVRLIVENNWDTVQGMLLSSLDIVGGA